ncbi:hypothetical protein GDO81_004939 [Engystomops pustulosus]|uniref:Uncharacterized protein n=1 Tax=Engystomops pustulosus TaxID=76066 RepID=A0AAV7CJK6_ENGPU|nr:hypothetical protein GDO81_004939 [Engystomops pustulosus]
MSFVDTHFFQDKVVSPTPLFKKGPFIMDHSPRTTGCLHYHELDQPSCSFNHPGTIYGNSSQAKPLCSYPYTQTYQFFQHNITHTSFRVRLMGRFLIRSSLCV